MIMIKSISIKYPAGHTIQSDYLHDEKLFCPSCGTNYVWIEQGGGDYYEGPTHICISCETSFTLPRMQSVDNVYKQVIEQIKTV